MADAMTNTAMLDIQRLLALSSAPGTESVESGAAGDDSGDGNLGALYATLGARVEAHAAGAAIQDNAPVLESIEINPLLADFGKRFFGQVQTACHDLICGSSDANKDLRSKISDALHLGKDQIATAIAGLIATGLGIAAPIAGVLAIIIIQLFLKPGVTSLCQVWDKSLSSQPPATS